MLFSIRENIAVLNVECGELNALGRCSRGFKACGKHMLPNIYTTHFAMTAHLMLLLAPYPTNRVGVSIVVSFTFSQLFFYSCNFAFSVLLQTFLSKEPSETLDFSTIFDFSVNVRVLNLLFLVGWFGCFLGVSY